MTTTTTNRRQGVNSSKAIKIPVNAAAGTSITLSGEQTIDGVSCTEGMRVLVMSQTDSKTNGIYDVSTGSWTRSLDFDGDFDITQGTLLHVLGGINYSNTWWELSTTSPVIGTSSITFAQTFINDSDSLAFLQAGTGAVSRSVQTKLRERISVDDFGAAGDDSTDDYAAIQAAIDALQPGQTLCSTSGKKYRISDTLLWSNKYRTQCDFQGELRPHGAFDDYLIEFAGTSSDPDYVNVALTITIHNLRINGLLQSRGVKLSGIYLSNISNIHLNKCYGTAINIGHGYENQFYGITATLCKERAVTWTGAATAWDASTNYVVGNRIYRDPGAWSAATTYTAESLVSKSGKCFRSIQNLNLNNDPETSPAWWQEVDFEYYICRIANLAKDPWSASFYTTNTSVAGNRYWQYTPAFEALMHLENTNETGSILEVMHFFGVKLRDSTNRIYLYIDNAYGNAYVHDIAFFGAQFDACTAGIVAALPALGSLPTRPIMGLIGRVEHLGLYQNHFRSAAIDDGICLQLGLHDPSKVAKTPKMNGLIVSGEGDRATGIYAANATECAPAVISYEMTVGADIRDSSDPDDALHNDSLELVGTFAFVKVSGSTPSVQINETDAAVNNRLWSIAPASEELLIRALTDAGTGSTKQIAIKRTNQNVDSLDLEGGVGLNVTGSVQMGSFTSMTTGNVTGYITIIDAAGTPRYLACFGNVTNMASAGASTATLLGAARGSMALESAGVADARLVGTTA